jgi:hypothetical protein
MEPKKIPSTSILFMKDIAVVADLCILLGNSDTVCEDR